MMKLTLPIRFTLALGAALLLGLVLFLPQQSGEGEAYAEDEVQAEGAKKPSAAQGQQTLESQAMAVLDTYCVSCHGPDKQKGDTRFDALETIDTVDRQTLYANAQDVVHFEEMPPAKAKQPTDNEREVLLKWFKDQLTGTAAKKLEEKLREAKSGNYTDHEALFSGEHADKAGFTYDRRWLISEYIFNEKFNRIFDRAGGRRIDGKNTPVQGDSQHRFGPKLTNPFLLSRHAGIRYYANESLSGGDLLTMQGNAKAAADYVIDVKVPDHKYPYLPIVNDILALEIEHNETLERRQEFLNQHIIRVLQDIYGDEHEKLLPEFVPSQEPRQAGPESGQQTRGVDQRGVGHAALDIITVSMKRQEGKDLTKAQLYEAMEREWFNFGYNDRDIAIWIKYLNAYWDVYLERVESGRYSRHAWQAYKPLADDEMKVITETIRKHRKPGDRYLQIIDKCMADWEAGFKRERIAAGPPSDEQLDELVRQLMLLILEREPRAEEFERYRGIAGEYASSLGRRAMVKSLFQAVMLSTDFVYRSEFGVGEPDEHGRRMMSPHDASFALSYALTEASPDEELAKAAAEGRLSTRADYEREVRRMLAKRDQVTIIDETIDGDSFPSFTRMPIREMRFFRDFFGYDKAHTIFKDDERFGSPTRMDWIQKRIVAEADMLVEHIIESDQNVIEKLLTTDKFYAYHNGDSEAMQAGSDKLRKMYDYFKDKGWQDFTIEDLREHKAFFEETPIKAIRTKTWATPRHRSKPLKSFKDLMADLVVRVGPDEKNNPAPYHSGVRSRYRERMLAPELVRMFNIDMSDWDYAAEQPAKIEKRKGILTHPAWLMAFAANFETDPIHRGIWVQEKLLAGTIPDVPITVDAVIPPHPEKTFRQRLDDKTNNAYCMRCHVKINPLGIPFEIYDDFGRYRTEERLEYPEQLIKEIPEGNNPRIDTRDIYKTLPIDATGYLEGTGDPSLDGEVEDALDLIDRLGKSDRARQSIIRHAFRFFMGRNETLSDSKTLIDADRAYLESGGSYDEVIVSLLTSDSFIYRKKPETTE